HTHTHTHTHNHTHTHTHTHIHTHTHTRSHSHPSQAFCHTHTHTHTQTHTHTRDSRGSFRPSWVVIGLQHGAVSSGGVRNPLWKKNRMCRPTALQRAKNEELFN